MITLIIGGSKSGKSLLAQVLSKQLSIIRNGKLVYFATMIPMDDEDLNRIDKHRKDRSGWGFDCVEEGCDVYAASEKFNQSDVILFDSVTSYVMNVLFSDNDIVNNIRNEDIPLSLLALGKNSGDLVIVSDYIFSDSERYSQDVERYRSILGKSHVEIGKFADSIIECSFANIKVHKNTLNFDFSDVFEKFYNLAVNGAQEAAN